MSKLLSIIEISVNYIGLVGNSDVLGNKVNGCTLPPRVGEPSLRRKGSDKHAVVLGSTLDKSILCDSLNALEALGEIFLGCA